MGTLIYERDRIQPEGGRLPSVDPEVPDLSHGGMGSHGLFFMHRALRWELDNVHDLIKLIESSPVPLIVTAPDRSLEAPPAYPRPRYPRWAPQESGDHGQALARRGARVLPADEGGMKRYALTVQRSKTHCVERP